MLSDILTKTNKVDAKDKLVDQNGNPTDPEVYDGGQLPDFIVRASDELPIAAVQPGASDDMIENPLDLTFRTINEAVEQDQAEDQNVFVREGDFVQFEKLYYEIVTLEEPKLLFGQEDHKIEIAAKCIRARQGVFNAK